MNLKQKIAVLEEVEKYLETCTTVEQVDRGMSMMVDIEQQYAETLTELMEEVAPDYIPMEDFNKQVLRHMETK